MNIHDGIIEEVVDRLSDTHKLDLLRQNFINSVKLKGFYTADFLNLVSERCRTIRYEAVIFNDKNIKYDISRIKKVSISESSDIISFIDLFKDSRVLKHIYVDSKLDSINFLKEFKNIETVTFSTNFSADIDALKYITNLRSVTFSNDSKFNKTLEPLRELKHLENLTLGYYFQGSLEPIKNLKLKKLVIHSLNVESISSIKNITSLKIIMFPMEFNKDISFLENFTDLRSVRFGYRFNDSIEPLLKLKHLKEVHLGYMFNKPHNILQDKGVKISKVSIDISDNELD